MFLYYTAKKQGKSWQTRSQESTTLKSSLSFPWSGRYTLLPTFSQSHFSEVLFIQSLDKIPGICLQELSDEEKQKWNNEAAEAMEAYKKELEVYNKNVAEVPNNDN